MIEKHFKEIICVWLLALTFFSYLDTKDIRQVEEAVVHAMCSDIEDEQDTYDCQMAKYIIYR